MEIRTERQSDAKITKKRDGEMGTESKRQNQGKWESDGDKEKKKKKLNIEIIKKITKTPTLFNIGGSRGQVKI